VIIAVFTRWQQAKPLLYQMALALAVALRQTDACKKIASKI
jgi:hypothetical protein